MTDTIPLRPCPWCGPQRRLRLVARCERDGDVYIGHIKCERCGASGPSEYDGTEAGALLDACNTWNDRA